MHYEKDGKIQIKVIGLIFKTEIEPTQTHYFVTFSSDETWKQTWAKLFAPKSRKSSMPMLPNTLRVKIFRRESAKILGFFIPIGKHSNTNKTDF